MFDKETVGVDNAGFPSSEHTPQQNTCERNINNNESQTTPKREIWGNGWEFLMSCIALSVGLGNVWRFPFIALENGGGAFLIPYVIVLFLVGKPIYYLEMILGQFTSRGCVKVYNFAPILRGIGFGQFMIAFFTTTYYASLMALISRYLITSFFAILPWSYCRDEWGPDCINSTITTNVDTPVVFQGLKKTSAEFYFTKYVLNEISSIDDGIAAPNWILALTLAFSWVLVLAICIRGIKTSGKAAYFLAIFPYVILLILLIRALTLPGAIDGVLYFLKPQWDKILDAKVWYAAVTQVFFSLTVCNGVILMYSSYNNFDHNIRRDGNIVTCLDTFTSLLSGIVIFGTLGNLAHEIGTTDIKSVVQGGPGLAFISYPDAIAKFTVVPQVFSVLFFLMMFTLGVGSNVGLFTCVIAFFRDFFPNVKRWILVTILAVILYCFGLIYITPGGQHMLNFVDFYGVTFVAIVLGICELISAAWVYGVKNICRDAEFMLNVKTSLYYRICWSIITPMFMTAVLVYTLIQYKPITYHDVSYPEWLYGIGWCISSLGIGQIIIWAIITVYKMTEPKLSERLANGFRPSTEWGPLEPALFKAYQQTLYDNKMSEQQECKKTGICFKIYDNIFN